jgi:hypothetical protein
MFISKFKIQNFRSIIEQELQLKNLNVFVGKNDAGKSNFVRALHLFFSDRSGYNFDWNTDFCQFAPVRKKKADEITITLHIDLPGYSGVPNVIWTKVWRNGGLYSDDLVQGDGGAIPSKSKAPYLLRNARFDYVPATKSDHFFSELLISIYEMLQRTAHQDLINASSALTTVIGKHTKNILDQLFSSLGLTSQIAPPTDLRHIFSALDFQSKTNGKTFSLHQRGDGIKSRHIPIILDWLASQARTLSAKGRPAVITVWGYEEPENNLEMAACDVVAKFFLEKCTTHQTFITTHSPSFYSLLLEDQKNRVVVFGISKQDSSTAPQTEFRVITHENLDEVDDSMGLMPLITPRLKPIQDELLRIKDIKQHLPKPDKPVIFVEGTTDKTVLEKIFQHATPAIDVYIEANAKEDDISGCANWVADRLIAWAYVQPANQLAGENFATKRARMAIGLFDADAAGQDAKKRCAEDPKCKKSPFTKTMQLATSPRLKVLKEKGFGITGGLEELFSEVVWNHAEEKGWLEERDDLIKLYSYSDTTKSFDQHLEDSELTAHEKRLVTKKVKAAKKGVLARYIATLEEPALAPLLENFKFTLDQIRKNIGIT